MCRVYGVIKIYFIIIRAAEAESRIEIFCVRPVVAADERMQFQEIFKCLAKKDENGEWFLNFVSLYVGLIVVLHFDEKVIESNFFDDMVVGKCNEI